MTRFAAALAVFALGLLLAALAVAAPQKDTFKLSANLKPRSEVPKPRGVPAGATGLMKGTAVELAKDRARITWRLTFSKLSGPALQARVHAGKPGTSGNVLAALCAPCRNGQRGSATITQAQLRVIERGGAYVNVHTKRNAAGEVRGQVKASGASSSDDSSSTDTTTTNTTPYP